MIILLINIPDVHTSCLVKFWGVTTFKRLNEFKSKNKIPKKPSPKLGKQKKNPQNNACFIDKHCKYYVMDKHKYFNKFTK